MSQRRPFLPCLAGFVLTLAALAPPLQADGGITFHDVADDPSSGITYARTGSPDRQALRDIVSAGNWHLSQLNFVRFELSPQRARGTPGVALFDYDGDGDLDIYATNGPGTANSLYSSLFAQTGQVIFTDVATAAGVDATSQDSSGVCFGDIDNDGDHDLYVLGLGEPNRLFENQGDGTFADISANAGVGGGGRHSIGCSMGDVDGDGLLDLYVGNTYDDWSHRLAFVATYPGLEHNQLFINQGGNVFTDESAARGIENVSNMNQPGLSGAAWTWAVGMADYDMDGDLDIFSVDNQGLAPNNPAAERGWIRLFENDGSGHLTDVTPGSGLDAVGGWMGISFGDLNCDGALDLFASDLGYAALQASRWFYGSAAGTFTDSGAGDLVMTPFGWGTEIFDHDNDGDADILYHGGMDLIFNIDMTNPGVLLNNDGDCSSHFTYTPSAFPKDHRLRTVEGVAVGDMNQDGFDDIVTVASFDVVPQNFSLIIDTGFPPTGSPFDAVAGTEPTFDVGPGLFIFYLHPVLPDGTLAVELSSADNGNGWAEVTVRGGAGVHPTAGVNRDGIGAVVTFTPDGGNTAIVPIVGGSSHSSQHALAAGFGLGSAPTGTVDVLWPGGVKNRLYDVSSGERVLFPEIPCSFDAAWPSREAFRLCVRDALKTYRHPSVAWISNPEGFKRFEDSMLQAYDETH